MVTTAFFNGPVWLRRLLDGATARNEFERLLAKARTALAADERFSNVRWMTSDEYDEHARSHPLKETTFNDPDGER
jgi:hypothetical protein